MQIELPEPTDVQVTKHTCEAHKNGAAANYPGCSCSASYSASVKSSPAVITDKDGNTRDVTRVPLREVFDQ